MVEQILGRRASIEALQVGLTELLWAFVETSRSLN